MVWPVRLGVGRPMIRSRGRWEAHDEDKGEFVKKKKKFENHCVGVCDAFLLWDSFSHLAFMTETTFINDGKLLSISNHLAMASCVGLQGTLANPPESFSHLGQCPRTPGDPVLHHDALPKTQSLGETDQMQNTKKG